MSCIKFSINNRKFKVDSSTPRYTVLRDYIHYVAGLPGTKAMCLQGGCGACLVLVKALKLTTGRVETFTVNSCLVLVFQCHGWEIMTIEGVGNRLEGYSDVQKRIAAMNGSQCGYCTPGWVMQLTSLKDRELTMAELETSFGSNTCRCTGYRPILDTIKSFAKDYPKNLSPKVNDIEDLDLCSQIRKRRLTDNSYISGNSDWCLVKEFEEIEQDEIIILSFGEDRFYKVFTEEEILDILDEHEAEACMMIDGNTGRGVFPKDLASILIDISGVESLKLKSFNQNLTIGANVSLEDSIQIFKETSRSRNEFSYLAEIAKHFEEVAHISVRNIGSLAGNVMLKHSHPNYQSDVYLLFETIGAMVTIRSRGMSNVFTMSEFLQLNMKGNILINFQLPPLSSSHIFKTEKIMPRHQNALAIVNAAFLFKLNNDQTVAEARIAFGNISPEFSRATKTEIYLKGKSLFTNATLQQALQILDKEIVPVDNPPEISPKYRKKLALGIFYKFILSICPTTLLDAKYYSGRQKIQRPLSQGKQNFKTHPELYPLNEPIPKLEEVTQSSGEAQYANDTPSTRNDVFGAFVLSTIHVGEIDYIETSEPLKIKGVVAVFTAEDIPGINSFTVPGLKGLTELEEILATSIKYYGQPVAIVVAENFILATSVAKKVKVIYKNISSNDPVLTISKARNDSKRYIRSDHSIKPKGRGNNVKNVIKGFYEIPNQYHYYIEPISCVATPVEEGLEIYDSTQWSALTQSAVAKCLNMKQSQVLVKVRRLGGAFGGKITRQTQASTACALVAKKLNVTCRFVLPLETNITIAGRRLPCQIEYEVGVDNDGLIQYLDANVIEDKGYSNNDNDIIIITLVGISNCYDTKYFDVSIGTVFTDLPSNTWFRGPGNLEGIACIEQIMEHIAFVTNKSPDGVRIANMKKEYNDLPSLIENLKKDANYDERVREIEKFNATNRWMKKAIKISNIIFPISYFFGNFTSMVSIYSVDGTVTITTGGIEMGQGLNTKVAQVCAYELGIPLELISVLSNYSFVGSNNMSTAASASTQSVCYATIRACRSLNKRLKPIREQMTNPTWMEVVQKAAEQYIDLTAKYTMHDHEKELNDYVVSGVAILEVQLDILLGRFEILRVDILVDAGLSTNPILDVGQLEGAYIQALGYFTSEKLVFDKKTGRLLTNHFLNYHVPLALDIPADFRINLNHNEIKPYGVLGAKTVSEMGTCLSHGITHALRQCVFESQSDSGYEKQWIAMDIPCDTESLLKALDVKIEEFLIQ